MDSWSIILLLTLAGLMVLPMLPAMCELYFPTDDKPLRVVQAYDGDIRHFANSFRRYVTNVLASAQAQSIDTDAPDKEPEYDIIPEGGAVAGEGRHVRRTIISQFPLTLPSDKFFESEIYSARPIRAGHHGFFRAILGNDEVHLADDCRVLRWVHSDESLYIGNRCQIFGRASANKKISLGDDSVFERLQAPRMEFGTWYSQLPQPERKRTLVEDWPSVESHFERRWLMKGNFELSGDSIFDGDVVAKKNMDIGSHCEIKGSVKSNGYLLLAEHTTIQGAAISTGALRIGPNCRIKGPVISEESIHIEAGTIIGSEEALASISAPIIIIESGVIVHGAVWAREQGLVDAKKPRARKEAL